MDDRQDMPRTPPVTAATWPARDQDAANRYATSGRVQLPNTGTTAWLTVQSMPGGAAYLALHLSKDGDAQTAMIINELAGAEILTAWLIPMEAATLIPIVRDAHGCIALHDFTGETA